VDLLATHHSTVARYNGGANAGHTIVHGGKKFALNLLPSGIIQPECQNLIGNGVVLHIPKLLDEIESLKKNGVDPAGKLFISDRCHLLFDFHQIIDGMTENNLGKDQIGTTKKGIGPCYASKMTRNNLRVGDFRYWKHFEINLRRLCQSLQKKYSFDYDVDAEIEKYQKYRDIIAPMIVDGVEWIHNKMSEGKSILLEGANAVMLDIDFGTYPFVTSSSPCAGGACTGLGIPPSKIGEVYGVVKAYCTRVGAGPFPTELHDELDDTLRDSGHEYGTTTGRPRRCGWLDLTQVKYSHRINDFHSICLTKLDCLNVLDEIKLGVGYKFQGESLSTMPSNLETLAHVEVEYETFPGFKGTDISKCRKFEELPDSAQKYVLRIEEVLGVPVQWIGVGPEREAIIERKG